jgi:hypothetical protein
MMAIAPGHNARGDGAQSGVFTIISVNSPRRFDETMAEGLMAMASHGQPVVVTPFTLMGAMAPVSLAAALAQQNAEALFGVALAQAVRPRRPVMYGAFTSNVDMRSVAPAFGTPENAKAHVASAQLARRYRLPYRNLQRERLECRRRAGSVRDPDVAVGRDSRMATSSITGRVARRRPDCLVRETRARCRDAAADDGVLSADDRQRSRAGVRGDQTGCGARQARAHLATGGHFFRGGSHSRAIRARLLACQSEGRAGLSVPRAVRQGVPRRCAASCLPMLPCEPGAPVWDSRPHPFPGRVVLRSPRSSAADTLDQGPSVCDRMMSCPRAGCGIYVCPVRRAGDWKRAADQGLTGASPRLYLALPTGFEPEFGSAPFKSH